MADYTDLPNTAVGVGGIPSGTTVTALRDNPIAIAEGATGAPRIVFAAIQDGVAGVSFGGVGTYAFARSTAGADVAEGATIAGSSLVPTSAQTSQNGTFAGSYGFASGSALTGTWRAMGYYDESQSGSSAGTTDGATLWLRIS